MDGFSLPKPLISKRIRLNHKVRQGFRQGRKEFKINNAAVTFLQSEAPP